MTKISRRLLSVASAFAACLILAGCGGNAPYSPIIGDTAAPPNVLLLTDTSTFTVGEGAVADFPFILKAVGSFSSSVDITVHDLPLPWTLDPATTLVPSAAGTQMNLKVNTSGAAPGDYTFKVRVAGDDLTHEATFTLRVTGITVSVAPSVSVVTPSAPATYTITVVPVNGHTGTATLAVTGLPQGIDAALTPGAIELQGPDSRTAQLVLSVMPAKRSRRSEGGTTFTVTATSGATSATATAQVILDLTGGIDGVIR